MKYKVEKIELNDTSNWKSFNNLRNDDGVLKELENVANANGELVTSYKAVTRAHAIMKVDKDTFDSLVAQGIITTNEE